MKIVFIILFCVISWLSLGAIASNTMMMAMSIDLPEGTYIGAVEGTLIGLLCSPLIILKRKHKHIFTILSICFVVAFPIALISGFTGNPRLAKGLSIFSYLSVYYLLVRDSSPDEIALFEKKIIYVVPVLCLIVASVVAYNYEDPSIPKDIPSLIEMMGDNDIGRHMDAARKLKAYGKAPFLIAIKHENPNVRARAAHFLGLFKEASVQDVLIDASADSDPHVRMWLAYSLGQIGDSKALPALKVLANDKEEIVSSQAKEAIEQIQKRTN
jgi:hypothetical protein